MPLDAEAIGRGCTAKLGQANQLCGLDLDRFKEALAAGAPITVACTQEAPLFREVAENFPEAQLTFVNIRETGGWSKDAAAAGPKAAALIAAAGEDMPPLSLVTLESSGVALIYGRDEIAIEAAQRLADRLDITVLLTKPGDVAAAPHERISRAQGHDPQCKRTSRAVRACDRRLRAALPLLARKTRVRAFAQRRHFHLRSDPRSLGDAAFPAHELRPGYLRADPRDKAAVERAIADAGGLVGTFDKPRFVNFEPSLCAHSRSSITGCTRCLDLCPTGAITPNGNAVAIDANVCAGCGSCASVCPTGAASYALPSADALMRRLRTLLQTYRKAGGSDAVVLFHDGEHGEDIIDALARFGEGLPANVLPLRVNEVTQLGPELLASVFAYGGSGVALLTRAKPRHDITALRRAVETADRVVSALGFGTGIIQIIETDDPDQLRAMLDAAPRGVTTQKPAGFMPRGAKRGVLETTFRELHLAAPTPVDVVPLAPGAPFGTVNLDVDGCTLCHACVTACPTGALSDNPDRAMLRFTESLCVQCGLCESTCPEKVISIEPRLDFQAWNTPQRVLKEEEPFNCIACGKPFGTKSSIDRVLAKLGEKHWMFQGANAKRLDVIKMCADCRVEAVVNESFDPHAGPQRPPVMTTEDYLRARDVKKDDPLGS